MAVLVAEGSQRLDYRLNTLKCFATSVTNVISAATTCGSAFQHEVERERSSFDAFMESSPWNDAEFCDGLQSFFRSMERSGQAFAALAASLTFHTAQPLLTLSKELVTIRDNVISQITLHDKQVKDCKNALTAAKNRKLEMTAKLDNWERERKQFEDNKDKRMISMFSKKNTARLDRKLRAAVAGQHAAMEEVAVRAQAAELAQKELENTYSKLLVTLQKSEARLCRMVVTSLTAVAGSVEENVEAMRGAAEYACLGAQSIRRVHDMEENSTNAHTMPSPLWSQHTLNPFADDGLIIPPGGRPALLRTLKASQSMSKDDSSDDDSGSAFPSSMVSRITEETNPSTRTYDVRASGRIQARTSRGWWNDVDVRSPGEALPNSSTAGREMPIRHSETGAGNHNATPSGSASSSEYTSTSLTASDAHDTGDDKTPVEPGPKSPEHLRDSTVAFDRSAQNLKPADFDVHDKARIHSAMSDALADPEGLKRSAQDGHNALGIGSMINVEDELVDAEDEEKLMQLVENADFAE
eukprot:GEMP01023475.1.p1 GENE.GEMP01023475.1~~GEMP01023475.1.p1  ORF type:complete len:526 (+),score=100.99 GEMP01023475.1:86-1663(+)